MKYVKMWRNSSSFCLESFLSVLRNYSLGCLSIRVKMYYFKLWSVLPYVKMMEEDFLDKSTTVKRHRSRTLCVTLILCFVPRRCRLRIVWHGLYILSIKIITNLNLGLRLHKIYLFLPPIFARVGERQKLIKSD